MAFYRTRQALVAAGLVLQRRDVHPGTRLDAILPHSSERRLKWKALQEASQLRFPGLACSWAAWEVPAQAGAVLIGLLGGLALPHRIPRLAKAFPLGAHTVGDLARQVLALNYRALADEAKSWNERDVWEALRTVFVEQTGVRREDVTPGARIAEDLRIC